MNAPTPVKLRKAVRVVGKTLAFRDATVADAAFILSLRTDTEKSRYLSAVSNELGDQKTWLTRYAQADNQAYFIIEHQGESIGTVRLYDPQGDSFCWGSWILANTRPRQAAIESALMVYAYAIDHLGFQAAHFDVRKGNERVIKFHERFGAIQTDETEQDYLFKIDHPAIQAARARYTEFLAAGVTVTFHEPA